MSGSLERSVTDSDAAADRAEDQAWDPLRRFTSSRIGLHRRGYGLATTDVLTFQADHAAARDAVLTPMDLDTLRAGIAALGLGEPVTVASSASSRAEYLKRPDLGRVPASLADLQHSGADIAIVVADGLSATAADQHAVGLVAALVTTLSPTFTLATPVIAEQARVALGDHIGQALGVELMVMIIGERPGLSVADSVGIYLTYRPRPGRTDAERNCISNIHPPGGLGYVEAARIVAALAVGARELGASGVDLKDLSSPEQAFPLASDAGVSAQASESPAPG